MATATESTPLDLKAEFGRLDKPYQTCSTFYKRTESILEDKNVDKLTLAILQQYKLGHKEIPIRIQINEKRKQLIRTWETMKIGIVGDVAAGKTSLINYLMGDEYLPVDQGVCTKVICEVYNSDFKLVEVQYCDDTAQEKLLENNPGERNWQWLCEIIENGYIYCELTKQKVEVRRCKIFWPFGIFQDEQTEVKVPVETNDGSEGKDEMAAPMKYKSPAVAFLDFPGLDDEIDSNGTPIRIKPILKAILSNQVDGLLFVIDNSLNNGIHETLKTCMSSIKNILPEFDVNTCLFVCNKWDMVSKKEHKRAELKQTILSKLREQFQTVQDDQIVTFSCIKQKSQDNGELLNKHLYRFLKSIRRQTLEQYWLWLIDLCEVAYGLMRNQRRWCKTEETLEEIQEKAKKDVNFLQNVRSDLISNGTTILDNKTAQIKMEYEAFLKGRLFEHCRFRKLSAKEESSFSNDLYEARRDFSLKLQMFKEDIDIWFQTLQNNILRRSWLLDLFHNTSIKSYKYDFLLFAEVAVIPLAKLILVGTFIKEEVNELYMNDPNYRIKMEINGLSTHVRELLQNFIDHLDGQINIMNNIEQLELQPCTEKILNRLQHVIDGLLTVFIQEVAVHEIKSANVEVVREIDRSRHIVHEVKYKDLVLARKKIPLKISRSIYDDEHDESFSSKTVSTKISYCKELLLLRKLKELETDPDYNNFVQYKGSCFEEDADFVVLYFFMEKCEWNLADGYDVQAVDFRKRIDLCIGAARGVNFLHKNGVVHRDIKPQNFLIRDGVVKICDVGHSKEEDKIASLGKNRGTKKYHPPEITSDDALHTTKSDIHSLGLVFSEVWGDPVLTDTGTFKKCPDPRVPKKVQTRMREIILSCLKNNPNERPDIQTVLHHLEGSVLNAQ